MKQTTIIILAMLLAVPVLETDAQDLSATEIIQKSTDLLNGESSKGTMKMTVVRPSWSREVTMKSWSMTDEYYLILITAPVKDKGQTFLKRQTDMWNWMPSINKMIKIPPSMMSQSWMGSDFTNDDLVKMNSYVNQYTHKIVGEEVVEGHDCYKIELLPKPDAAVVWGKVLAWISKEEYYQLKLEFYDEDMELVNRQECFDIKQFGDRKLPSMLVMTPVDEPGNKTIIEILENEFNIDINESFFSQQNMKKIR
ncbi:MAG: outer membrane lipoprotein-sorting protein [Bacteroidales bacterium]|jgi:outer membrane lipoprotein-sorting protein|nr:outer membrane lipoprotein-sorting protein [Bacteroidales bacterium]